MSTGMLCKLFSKRTNLTFGYRGNYRDAFLSCRKHRIDLNVLIDYDPDAFMERLPSFTQQVNEVDYINLFLSGVG